MMKIHTAIENVVLYVTVIFAAANNITALPTTDRLELSTKLIDEQVNQRNGSYLLLTTPDSKLKNIAFSDQVTTDNPGLPKNAILGLLIGSLIVLALIMAPCLLSCSKKRRAERKVKRFQTKRSSKQENPRRKVNFQNTSKTSKSTVVEGNVENSLSGLAIKETGNSQDLSESRNRLPKKSSLKCSTAIPGIEIQASHDMPTIISRCNRKMANVRPVSVDFGAGISFMRRDKNACNKLTSGNERKRHSTQVVMESHLQSDPLIGMTLLQNLAYEDFIPYGLRIPDRGNVASILQTHHGKEISNEPFDRIPGDRGRKEHQYETITCTSSGMKFEPTIERNYRRLRPPSPIQIKRQSKSEDLTIFPVRYSRNSEQTEMKCLVEERNKKCDALANVSIGYTTEAGMDDKKTLPHELSAKCGSGTRERRFWSPPTIKIKRKRMIFQCGKETKAVESCATVEQSLEREILPNNKSFDENNIKHYPRERSKSEPVKSIRKKESEIQSSAPRAPQISHKEVSRLMDASKKKIRKAKRFRVKRAVKKEKGGKKLSTNHAHHKQVLKNPIELTRQRHCRVKKKVRKNRRSRDELRHKLQLRLMGYGSNNITDMNGTAESYKEENNERFSGFIAQSRKVALDAYSSDSCAGTESLQTGEFLRRKSSRFEGKWDESRPNEATLLEEIWKHLNVIAERSRLLKDSSSSRRRSQSLTSSDTPIFKRKRREAVHDDFQQETSTEEEDDDSEDTEQSDNENALGVNEESTSDYGYCTFNNLSRAGLRSGLQINLNKGADDLSVGVSLSSSLSKNGLFMNSKLIESGSASNDYMRWNGIATAVELAALKEKNDEKLDATFCSSQRKKPVEYSVTNDNAKSNGIQMQTTAPVYENLTEFCSFPSSISSSTSSLAITSSPNFLTSKSLSSKGAIQKQLQVRNLNFMENELKWPKQTDSLLSELVAEDMENETVITTMEHSVTKSTISFIEPAKGYKMRQRANSEGNYVVIPPSILLKRKQATTRLRVTKHHMPNLKFLDKASLQNRIKNDKLVSDTLVGFRDRMDISAALTKDFEKPTDETITITEDRQDFNGIIEPPLQVFMHLQV